MHRCMCGVTKLDRVRNGRMREARKVGEIAKKVKERRRNWCGHMMRREDHYLGRRVMEMEVQLREAEERRA